MKRILVLLLLAAVPSVAQTWVPSLSQPQVTFNNVQIYDMTKPDPVKTVQYYGPVNVTSITTSGGVVTYTATRVLSYAAVGHTICITIGGDSGGSCTSGGTILTPGNPVPADLLGTCVLTAVHTTPTPTTYSCATTATDSWTLLDPNANQQASTIISNNQLWQVFTESTNAGPGTMTYPGLLYIRTSSSTPTTFPPVWNTPVQLDTSVIPSCPVVGDRPDVRIPMLGGMPNGDQVIWFVAYCIHSGQQYVTSVWWFHHDHTQALNAGWVLTQWTAIPPGWTSAQWGCFEQSGHLVADPTDGMPEFAVGGQQVVAGQTSLCINSYVWLIKTTNNGNSWNFVYTSPMFNGTTPPTEEFSLSNPTGTTWISFLRNYGNCPINQFCSLYLATSTDNMATWTSWVPSNIPHSDACPRIFGQTPKGDNTVAPWSLCGSPTAGQCVLFYTDRMGCSSAGSTSEMAVQYDPSQVISSGATYTATLNPTVLSDGVIGSSLNGYLFPLFVNANTFHLFWHGIVNSATTIKLWQSSGQFSNTVSTLTIVGGGSYSGTVVSSAGGINCVITSGVASGTCTGTVVNGNPTTLTASVGRGSSFGGFGGWCLSGSPSSCSISVNTTVTATFNILIPDVWMSGKQRQGGKVISQ